MTSAFVRLLFVSSSQLELRGRGGTTRRAEVVGVVRRRGQPLAVRNSVGPMFIALDDDRENESARLMLAATRRNI